MWILVGNHKWLIVIFWLIISGKAGGSRKKEVKLQYWRFIGLNCDLNWKVLFTNEGRYFCGHFFALEVNIYSKEEICIMG